MGSSTFDGSVAYLKTHTDAKTLNAVHTPTKEKTPSHEAEGSLRRKPPIGYWQRATQG